MKNLLITGGTGFFGRALLRQLDSVWRAEGSLPFDKITVVSRSPDNFRRRFPKLASLPWLGWHLGDVLFPSTLPKNCNYHYIIHAASDSTDAANLTLLQTYHQIVDGTENILKFATTCGNKRFLMVSSGGVYGPQPAEIKAISESFNAMPDPLNPLNAYGVAKRNAEHLCAQYGYQYGIATIIARCFSFVGEDLPTDAHFAIGNFIRDAMYRPEIIVNGDGSPIRSYMHQGDLAHWLLTLLQYGAYGSAYNVGSDQSIKIADLACLVRDTLSPQKEVKINGDLIADNSDRNLFVPNVDKAKIELELQITVSLPEAIRLSVIQPS